MLSFCNKYARNIFSSQNGEEGILLEIVRRIGIEREGNAVEIGGHDGLYCSNTALLIRDYGWCGRFVESNFDLWRQCVHNWRDNTKVRSTCALVDTNSINNFVDDSTDLLSLDTDGLDYQLFKALVSRPKIVVVEIDSSMPPDQRGFNADGGASYLEMLLLAYELGYVLLCHTGNMIFIRFDFEHLFPEFIGTSALSDMDLYFNRSWIKELQPNVA